MELPFKTTNVFHKHGGRVLEITSIKHQTDKPRGGHSMDAWYFMGKVQWEDGSGSPDKLHPIDMPCLCADTDEGRAEIRALSDAMMAYLNTHGVWNDKGPHEGWYAHRPEKRRAA